MLFFIVSLPWNEDWSYIVLCFKNSFFAPADKKFSRPLILFAFALAFVIVLSVDFVLEKFGASMGLRSETSLLSLNDSLPRNSSKFLSLSDC